MPTTKQINEGFASRVKNRKLPAYMLVLAAFLGGGEGLRQTVYVDPVGIPTVCFGETGKHVQLGQPARSVDECSDLMLDRLVGIDKRLDEIVKVPLTAGEKIAYSSFIYNMGEGKPDVKDGFVWLKARDSQGKPRKSTLYLMLNAGQHVAACNQLQFWNNPKWLRGLTIRRAEETKFCLRDLQVTGASNWHAPMILPAWAVVSPAFRSANDPAYAEVVKHAA